MRIDDPLAIELEYVRRMMVWMLVRDATALAGAHAVQLGLGAGAITRFCSKRLKMRCTAVELNPRVVDVCRQWFRLPPPSPGFEILGMDAQRFVDDPRRRGTIDVLCVDLYDHEAASPVLDSAAFYRACFDVLAAGGVMTVNLFGHNASFETSTRRIAAAFGAAGRADGPADERRQHRRAGDEASHVTGPGRACPACRKHRNSLAASGPEVAAHDAPGGPRGRADPNASRMKIRSDTDLSKAVAAAGIRAVPRPAEAAAANQGSASAGRRRRRVKALAPTRQHRRSRGRIRALDLDVAADDAAVDRSLAQRRLARQADLAHRARLAARRQDRQRRRHRAHGAPLRRRQQRPASAGADRQRRPDPRRRRQGARHRDADRVAGQAQQAALHAHRPAARSTSAASPT